MSTELLRLFLTSPGLTTSSGPQLPQAPGAKSSIVHNTPVTSLAFSTVTRNPRQTKMTVLGYRPGPEQDCPPFSLHSLIFPWCFSINNLANIPFSRMKIMCSQFY